MPSHAETQFAGFRGTLLLAVSLEPREIGKRIAKAREKRGWTQLAFALEANVSPSTVQRWESGKLPPVRELMRVADLLGVEAEELVEPEASPVSNAAVIARIEGVEAAIESLRQDLLKALRRRTSAGGGTS